MASTSLNQFDQISAAVKRLRFDVFDSRIERRATNAENDRQEAEAKRRADAAAAAEALVGSFSS